MIEEQGQDPLEQLKAMRRKSAPPTDPLARLKATRGSGPITPGHSKFTPDELQARADASVQEAHDETMDAQGDLISTLQAGVGAAELAPAALTRGLPALVRGGAKLIRPAMRNVGTMRDLALAASGSPRAAGRLAMRVADVMADVKKPSSPFTEGAVVRSDVVGVGPGSSRLRAPQGATVRTLDEAVSARPTAPVAVPATEAPISREAAQRDFQKVVDKYYEASPMTAPKIAARKGVPLDPPDDPDLMQQLAASLKQAAKGKTPKKVSPAKKAMDALEDRLERMAAPHAKPVKSVGMVRRASKPN